MPFAALNGFYSPEVLSRLYLAYDELYLEAVKGRATAFTKIEDKAFRGSLARRVLSIASTGEYDLARIKQIVAIKAAQSTALGNGEKHEARYYPNSSYVVA